MKGWWARRRAARDARREAFALNARDRVMAYDDSRVYTIDDVYADADPLYLPGQDRPVYGLAPRHDDACPLAPALFPLAAIGTSYAGPAGRTMVHHPPELCRYCETPVAVTDRSTRPKKNRYVYCCPEHKVAVLDRAWQSAQDRAELGLGPKPTAAAVRAVVCPHPQKRAYLTREDCEIAFADLMARDPGLEAYGCACGRFHAGHSSRRPVRGLSAPISELARITPARMPKTKPVHPVKEPTMPQPSGLAALQRVDPHPDVVYSVNNSIENGVRASLAHKAATIPAAPLGERLAAILEAALERTRHLSAGTPVFDALAEKHDLLVWMPHFEDHDGFMARAGQSVWLAELDSQLEAMRYRQSKVPLRDSLGRFIR